MSSKDQILANVRKNQPGIVALPGITGWEEKLYQTETLLDTFSTVARNIGTQVIMVHSLDEVKTYTRQNIASGLRVVTAIPALADVAEDYTYLNINDPHNLENVELAILQAEFGVAENSALWVTEKQMGIRALPFICQHLAMVVGASDLVPDMHAAYKRTAGSDHGFASFIAGPSKTADIEQSLVLGAHGPRSLTIFILVN